MGVFRGSRHSLPGRQASVILRVLRGSFFSLFLTTEGTEVHACPPARLPELSLVDGQGAVARRRPGETMQMAVVVCEPRKNPQFANAQPISFRIRTGYILR